MSALQHGRHLLVERNKHTLVLPTPSADVYVVEPCSLPQFSRQFRRAGSEQSRGKNFLRIICLSSVVGDDIDERPVLRLVN